MATDPKYRIPVVPMKISLLTAHTSEFQPLADITDVSKRLYALKHGYEYYQRHIPTRRDNATCSDLSVDRISLIRAVLSGTTDWLWFTGTDLLITNLCTPLTNFIKDADLYCAGDVNGLHCDSLLLRNCQQVDKFLDLSLMFVEKYHVNDQDAYAIVLSGHKTVESYETSVSGDGVDESTLSARLNRSDVKVEILENRYFNCVPPHHYQRDEPYEQMWRPGYFCLHMHGKALEYRLRHMPRYLKHTLETL